MNQTVPGRIPRQRLKFAAWHECTSALCNLCKRLWSDIKIIKMVSCKRTFFGVGILLQAKSKAQWLPYATYQSDDAKHHPRLHSNNGNNLRSRISFPKKGEGHIQDLLHVGFPAIGLVQKLRILGLWRSHLPYHLLCGFEAHAFSRGAAVTVVTTVWFVRTQASHVHQALRKQLLATPWQHGKALTADCFTNLVFSKILRACLSVQRAQWIERKLACQGMKKVLQPLLPMGLLMIALRSVFIPYQEFRAPQNKLVKRNPEDKLWKCYT